MLDVISDLIGFIALICLLGVLVYLVYARICGQFTWAMLWWLVVPFTIAIAGNILHSYSWYLADKHQFKYDYEKAISTWVNASGVQQSHKYGKDADKTDQPDLQWFHLPQPGHAQSWPNNRMYRSCRPGRT